MKQTQQHLVLKALKDGEWKFYHDLIRTPVGDGFLGTEAGRRVRELYENGQLEKQSVQRDGKWFVQYRLKRNKIVEELELLKKPIVINNQLNLI